MLQDSEEEIKDFIFYRIDCESEDMGMDRFIGDKN